MGRCANLLTSKSWLIWWNHPVHSHKFVQRCLSSLDVAFLDPKIARWWVWNLAALDLDQNKPIENPSQQSICSLSSRSLKRRCCARACHQICCILLQPQVVWLWWALGNCAQNYSQNQMIIQRPPGAVTSPSLMFTLLAIPALQVLLILTVQNSEIWTWNFGCSCYFGLNIAPEDGEMESEKKVVEELRYLRLFWSVYS